MSHGYAATDWAWEADVENSTDRLVLLGLAKWADEELVCFPTQEQIAEVTKLNRKTLIASIRRLEAAGLITRTRKKVDASTVYTLGGRAENGLTEIGCTKNGTTESGTAKNGTSRSTEIGTSGCTEIGTLTNKGTDKRTNKSTVPAPELTLESTTDPKASVSEKPKHSISKGSGLDWFGLPENLQSEFIQHRKAKRAAITQTVINLIKREADKAGWSFQQAIEEAMARGWQSFKADWVKSNSFDADMFAVSKRKTVEEDDDVFNAINWGSR